MAKKKQVIYSFGAMVSVLLAISWASGGSKAFKSAKATPVGKPISPDLFGIFFEDLNYAADGGLYAELVQNRAIMSI